jgi:hypothetical protein
MSRDVKYKVSQVHIRKMVNHKHVSIHARKDKDRSQWVRDLVKNTQQINIPIFISATILCYIGLTKDSRFIQLVRSRHILHAQLNCSSREAFSLFPYGEW